MDNLLREQENFANELSEIVRPYQELRHIQKSKLTLRGFGQIFVRFDVKWSTIKNKVEKTFDKYKDVIFSWEWDGDAHCIDVTFLNSPEDKTLNQLIKGEQNGLS